MRSQPPLPPQLAAALRPVLPSLVEETIAAIGREIPEYRRPIEGEFGRGLRAGVERALARFVDDIERPGEPADAAGATYVLLGRGEQRAGRSLDVLLSAYRLGARLAWEHFSAAADAAGHEPATLYALAGAIFTYIDAISAESVDGYAEEQSAAVSERAQRRRALARLLARDDAPAGEVEDLAALAGWPLPAQIAALVAEGEASERLAARIDPLVIAFSADGETTCFVPDPDAPGLRARLAAVLEGRPAALGPTVPLGRGAASVTRAQAALRLALAGRIEAQTPVVADEHLVALLLHAGDPSVTADLAARALEPLNVLKDGPRERLAETLRVWLDHPGQVQVVAGLLHVHPQTVRYRVAQLRELFGERLEDADARFAMALALRSRPVIREY